MRMILVTEDRNCYSPYGICCTVSTVHFKKVVCLCVKVSFKGLIFKHELPIAFCKDSKILFIQSINEAVLSILYVKICLPYLSRIGN